MATHLSTESKAAGIVTVYGDPITKLIPEGKAKVIKVQWEDDPLAYCTVRFLDREAGQEAVVDRWVDLEQLRGK